MRWLLLVLFASAVPGCGCGTPQMDFQVLDDNRNPGSCYAQYLTTWDPNSTTSTLQLPWAVGSAIRIYVGAHGGPVHFTSGGKAPFNWDNAVATPDKTLVATDPNVLVIESGPDETGIATLRAVGAGTGGITASSSHAASNTMTLRIVKPVSFRVSWYQAPPGSGPVASLALATGGTAQLTVSVLESNGEVLCASREAGTVSATGLTLTDAYPDGVEMPPLGPHVNGLIAIAATAAPQGTIDLNYGGSTGSVPVAIVPPSAFTSFTTSLEDKSTTVVKVRTLPQAAGLPVMGSLVHVENLSPDIARASDPVTLQDSTAFDTREAVTEIDELYLASTDGGNVGHYQPGTAQIRLSVPGTSLAPQTLSIPFTAP